MIAQRRVVVADRDGVALAEPAPGDAAVLAAGGPAPFEVDPDGRPLPYQPPLGSLVVLADGRLVGDVGWIPVFNGPTYACMAWSIGIDLLPTVRGRGIGSRAQRLLVEHLFATTDVDRVQATTDVDNIAEQRALERAGFRREGVLRGAQLRGGVRRDILLYGVLRTDLP
ncbi:MAG TPA: GNAT family protein [Pseudonocardiaceae bacterium]|nr:GNAT family protein [Pseudonocardiaceae bacterium]